MTEPHFVLADRLAHLDAAAWATLTRDAGVFLQAPFLRALEAASPENVSARYALLYDGDEAVAAVSLQLVRLTGRVSFAEDAPLRGVGQLLDERALVLGNLAGWGQTGLALKPGVDEPRVWREVLSLMDRLRRFEKSDGVVNVSLVKDAAPAGDAAALKAAGYQRAPSGPDMQLVLDPGWKTLEDYLGSLTSNARRSVKKTHAQLADAGYRLRPLEANELEAHTERLDALYGQVWANAEVRPLRLSGRFFVALHRHLPGACALLGLEKDGRLDGFVACLKSGARTVGYYLGYDKAAGAPLYLGLLLAVLEQALAWGSNTISMGRTAEEPKARLGAVPGPSSLWVRHRVPPLNWAVGAVLGGLQEAPVPSHRVFRELPPTPTLPPLRRERERS